MATICVEAPVAIFANISGVQTRLCTVVDNGIEGLRVYLQKVENLELGSEEYAVQQMHISAYPNEKSGTAYIHITKELNDLKLERLEDGLVGSRLDNDFAVAVISASVMDCQGRSPDKIKPKHGNIAWVHPYHGREATLVYCMAFSLPNLELPDLSHLGLSLIVVSGDKMNFGFYYTYLSIMSYVRGIYSTVGTSLTKVNGELGGRLGNGEVHSHPISDFPKWVSMQLLSVAGNHLSIIDEAATQNGEDVRNILRDVINTCAPLSNLLAEGVRVFDTLNGQVCI